MFEQDMCVCLYKWWKLRRLRLETIFVARNKLTSPFLIVLTSHLPSFANLASVFTGSGMNRLYHTPTVCLIVFSIDMWPPQLPSLIPICIAPSPPSITNSLIRYNFVSCIRLYTANARTSEPPSTEIIKKRVLLHSSCRQNPSQIPVWPFRRPSSAFHVRIDGHSVYYLLQLE